MPNLKILSYAINLFAGMAVIIIGIQSMDTFSLVALGFLIWAISPYLFTAWLVKLSIQYKTVIIVFGTSLILAIGGIYLFIDAMYVHPDPQGALVFVVIPMYQWAILFIVSLPIYISYRKRKNTTHS